MVLKCLQALGYDIALEGEEIVCRWLGVGPPEASEVRPLIEELREHKAEAVDWLRGGLDLPQSPADWPLAWRERYEERAAIIEHDGGLCRLEAETRAEALVRVSYRRQT
jgi:hypothetical protein